MDEPETGAVAVDSHVFNLLLAGDTFVGKTCLLDRFVTNSFTHQTHATLGCNYIKKSIKMYGKTILLKIYDPSGQDRYRSIRALYYGGTHGTIIVYDVTKKHTFDNLKTWLWDIETRCDNNVFKVLVGNKTDLSSRTEVDRTAAQDLASKHEMPFIETSALKGEGVDEAFLTVIRAIMKHRGLDQLQPDQTDKKKCMVS